MADAVKFEGTAVMMGGREFVAPPLSFGQIKRLKPVLEGLDAAQKNGGFNLDAIDGMVQVVHMALSRNYPDLTTEEVEEMLDTANVMKVFAAIMGVSGFVQGGERAAESAAT